MKRLLIQKLLFQKKYHQPIVLSHWSYRYNNQVNSNISSRQYSSERSTKSSGGGALLAVGALVLTGGATLAYAKYDPDFRKTLIHYIPFIEPLLKDNQSSGNIISEYYKSAKTSLFDLFTGKSGKSDTIVTSTGQRIEKSEPQEYKGKL